LRIAKNSHFGCSQDLLLRPKILALSAFLAAEEFIKVEESTHSAIYSCPCNRAVRSEACTYKQGQICRSCDERKESCAEIKVEGETHPLKEKVNSNGRRLDAAAQC